MKKLLLTVLTATIAIVGLACFAYAQGSPSGYPTLGGGKPILMAQEAQAAPPDANAMGTPVQKTPPAPVQQQYTPQPPSSKTKFGPPITVPWKKGGVYTLEDVKKMLETQGWAIFEAKDKAGRFFTPPKFELVSIDDTTWERAKKDLHMSLAKVYGKGGFTVTENVKYTPQWQHTLFRGGIEGVRSAVVDITVQSVPAPQTIPQNGRPRMQRTTAR